MEVDSSRAAAPVLELCVRVFYSVGRINILKTGSTLFGVEKRKCLDDTSRNLPLSTFAFFKSA